MMRFFRHKVAIDDETMERVRKHVERAGYASVEEFVRHCIDKEISAGEAPGEAGDDEMHRKRLRGLGYIE